MIETSHGLTRLYGAIDDLCAAFNDRSFTPLLESDVCAFLYHRLLANGLPLNQVCLTARVYGESERSRKPDIVIGEIDTARASVRPSVICEVKAFQRWGHSDQQMNRRFHGVLEEDIPTLGEMAEYLPYGRVELIVDLIVTPQRRGYLNGVCNGQTRLGAITSACSAVGAGLVWVRPDVGDSVARENVLEPAAPV